MVYKLNKHPVSYTQMQEKTDAELVQLARTDDKHAFHLLMERYQVMASCIALRMVSNEETARELVQEAMLQAFLSLDHLRDDTRFKSWFYGIMLNICRNARRAPRADSISLNSSAGNWLTDLQSPKDLTDPQIWVERQELRMMLDAALNVLSIKNRLAAQLFYYEEMSIQEIAQKLDISLTAVKNRLFKGREQLRAHLLATAPEMIPATTRKRRKDTMIKVSIAKVTQQDHFRTLVMLQDETQQRVLSIWLRTDRATLSEVMHMIPQTQNASTEPPTIDFLVNMLKVTRSVMSRVEIEELQDEILYARVYIYSHGEQKQLKARLNDALPLALRLSSEIYVADAVMEKQGQKLSQQTEPENQIATISNTLTQKMAVGMQGQTAITRKEPRNLDFADGLHGWWFMGFPKEESTYQIDHAVKRRRKESLTMTNQEAQPLSSASLHHEGFLAENYLGKRLRLRAYVKTDDVKQVMVGVTINGPKEALRLRQINAPTIRGTNDWDAHDIVFDVPNNAAFIKFSLHMMGKGQVWLDEVELAVVDSDIPVTEDAGPRTPFPEEPQNTHFAHNLAHWDLWGSHPQDYICGTATMVDLDGAPCGYIKSDATVPRGHGILRQTVRSKQYNGKQVRLLCNIKTLGVENQASLYIQLDGPGTNDMREKQLEGTNDWSKQEVTLFVPEQGAMMIRFGVMLYGKGQVWLDNIRIESI